MDWSYLGGFFDGEGCIHYSKQHDAYHCQVSQAVHPSHHVLRDIQAFLADYGIKSHLMFQKSKKEKHRDIHSLAIAGAGHVNRFLHEIIPFLIVKQETAQKALKYTTEILSRYYVLEADTIMRTPAVISDYMSGLSLFDIHAKYGFGVKTTRKILKRHNIKLRSQREAISLFWGK